MATFNFRTLELANKRKTIFLLISLGFLSWLVAFAALSYFATPHRRHTDSFRS